MLLGIFSAPRLCELYNCSSKTAVRKEKNTCFCTLSDRIIFPLNLKHEIRVNRGNHFWDSESGYLKPEGSSL